MSSIHFMGRQILPPVDTAEDDWLLSLETKEAVDVLLNNTTYPRQDPDACEDKLALSSEQNKQNLLDKQACLDLQAIAKKQENSLLEDSGENVSVVGVSEHPVSAKLPPHGAAASKVKASGNLKAIFLSKQNSVSASKKENSRKPPMFLQHQSSGYSSQQHKQLEHTTAAQQQQLMQKSQQEEQPKLLLQQKQKEHLRQQHLQFQQQQSYAFKVAVQEKVDWMPDDPSERPIKTSMDFYPPVGVQDLTQEDSAMTSSVSNILPLVVAPDVTPPSVPQPHHNHLDDYLIQLTGQPLPSTTIPNHHPISQSWSPALTTTASPFEASTPPDESRDALGSDGPTTVSTDEAGTLDSGQDVAELGSPSSEELPKWLREARSLKHKNHVNGRSIGSNYLDSYLGNLTQHSWLTFAPSTPTQQSLYMPKRVYLYPDAFYRKEPSHSQNLFMSRSFTEGFSDPSYEYLAQSKRSLKSGNSNKPPTTAGPTNLDNVIRDDRDSPAEFTSPSHASVRGGGTETALEDVSVAPSTGTESGMGGELYTSRFSPSLGGPSTCSSLPEATTVTTSEAEQSFAMDSLETDVPCFTTETSGVITHGSDDDDEDESDMAGGLQEGADEEVTISENFPDIPYETETDNPPTQEDDHVETKPATPDTTDVEKPQAPDIVVQVPEKEAKSGTNAEVTFDIGGPVGYEDNSAASDESSCCTQPSTIVMLREMSSSPALTTDTNQVNRSSSPAPTSVTSQDKVSSSPALSNVTSLGKVSSPVLASVTSQGKVSSSPAPTTSPNHVKMSSVPTPTPATNPVKVPVPSAALLDKVKASPVEISDTTSIHTVNESTSRRNESDVVDNINLLNNLKNLQTNIRNTKEIVTTNSLDSSLDSITNVVSKMSVDCNDNSTTSSHPSVDERESRATVTVCNSGNLNNSSRNVSFDFSNKSRTSTPETSVRTGTPDASVMSTSSVSEAMCSSLAGSEDANANTESSAKVVHLEEDTFSKDLASNSKSNNTECAKSEVNDSSHAKRDDSDVSTGSELSNSLVPVESVAISRVNDTRHVQPTFTVSGTVTPVSADLTVSSTAHPTVISPSIAVTNPASVTFAPTPKSTAFSPPGFHHHSRSSSAGGSPSSLFTGHTPTGGVSFGSSTVAFTSSPSKATPPTTSIGNTPTFHPSSAVSNNNCLYSPSSSNAASVANGAVVPATSMPHQPRVTTPLSSPHRHSTPTTPSNTLYSPVTAGTPILGKCSSRQHQINALLQLLRVQHHHEREQLILKQQEEMQQFVQHLQKLTPAQLQHIVSAQVNSVQSNRVSAGSNTGSAVTCGYRTAEAEGKSPVGTSDALPSSSSQATTAPDSSSPCDDSYSGNSVAASQSTPSVSEGKAVVNHTNVMPSFYLHNPATSSAAAGSTTPVHLNKLFLQFPSKKSPSPSGPPFKVCTPPHHPKLPCSSVSPSHVLPHSQSSADLTRLRHFSRSQSEGTCPDHPPPNVSAGAVPNADAVYGSSHTVIMSPSGTTSGLPEPNQSKPLKQAFNEKQANYGRRSSNSNSNSSIKEKMLCNTIQSNPSSQLAPITPREDMAELSNSLTNSDIFNSLQSSMVSDSGLGSAASGMGGSGSIPRSATITKLTTETFMPAVGGGVQRTRRRTQDRLPSPRYTGGGPPCRQLRASSDSAAVVRGMVRLQATLRGRHVRRLLASSAIQRHVATLAEVNKLAAQFHRDLLADNINKGDIDFHRALFHQEQVARNELWRLFFSCSMEEQIKIIHRDKLQRQSKLPSSASLCHTSYTRQPGSARRATPASSSNTLAPPSSRSRAHSAGYTTPSGGSSNKTSPQGSNCSNARSRSYSNGRHIPTLKRSQPSCTNDAPTCASSCKSIASSRPASYYSHVQSRYLANLSKTAKSKLESTPRNRNTRSYCGGTGQQHRVLLPNCAASPSLSSSTPARPHNEKMCQQRAAQQQQQRAAQQQAAYKGSASAASATRKHAPSALAGNGDRRSARKFWR